MPSKKLSKKLSKKRRNLSARNDAAGKVALVGDQTTRRFIMKLFPHGQAVLSETACLFSFLQGRVPAS